MSAETTNFARRSRAISGPRPSGIATGASFACGGDHLLRQIFLARAEADHAAPAVALDKPAMQFAVALSRPALRAPAAAGIQHEKFAADMCAASSRATTCFVFRGRSRAESADAKFPAPACRASVRL